MFVLIALMIRVESTRVPGTRGISKIQEVINKLHFQRKYILVLINV